MGLPQGHHRFGFSALPRRLPCPGSAGQEAAAEVEGSAPPIESFAVAGTTFHGHLEEGTTPEDPDDAAAIGWVREEWAKDVPETATPTMYEDRVRVLTPAGETLAWGHLDMLRADLISKTGHIGETKSGWVLHEPEIVAPQLIGQCIAVLCEYEQLDAVTNTCYHARFRTKTTVSLTREALQEAVAWYEDIVRAGDAPDAPLNAGSHCRYCSGRVRCPAVKGLADRYALKRPEPSSIETGAELAQYLEAVDLLEGWCDAVKRHAKSMALRGVEVPGRRLQRIAGARYIPNLPDLAAVVGQYLSPEQILAAADVPITAFEKMFAAQYKAVHGGTVVNAKAVLADLAGPLIAHKAEQTRFIREKGKKK